MHSPLQARKDSDAAQTDTAKTAAQKRWLADNRPEALAQRKLAEMMNNRPRVLQQRAQSDAIQNSPQMLVQRHKMNALFDSVMKSQGDSATPAESSPAQRAEKPNNTGLPSQLKSGIESLSGMSMDHVKVHYNSDKPAQLQAHAYAQGSEIHVAPGQEQHLPHEAWHVVQQAQGRVHQAKMVNGSFAINDDVALESEADAKGRQAAQMSTKVNMAKASGGDTGLLMLQRVQQMANSSAQTSQFKRQAKTGKAPKGAPLLAAQLQIKNPVQRMVAVAHKEDDTENDYAVMKVVKELSSRRDAGQVVDLKIGSTDFSQLAPTERIYIAGHGNRDTGDIKGIDTKGLIAALIHPKRGVPAVFGGVTVMSCYGGLPHEGGSLAEKIASGLRVARKGMGSTVLGAKGYAFGSPKIGSDGKASVVDLKMEDFYFLAKPQVLWHTWQDTKPTHSDGILKEKYKDMVVDPAVNIKKNIIDYYAAKNLYEGTREVQLKIDILEILTPFVNKARGLEAIFNNLITAIPGKNVKEKLTILNGQTQGVSGKAKLGNYVKRWNAAVNQQEYLFNKFYVWKTVDDSFASVII